MRDLFNTDQFIQGAAPDLLYVFITSLFNCNFFNQKKNRAN